jgi:hypothetical protein
MKSRVLGIAILLVCAVTLTGCEQACDIFVCNSSDKELLLYREPIAIGVTIRPCSVRIVQLVSCAFPVSIRVTDSSGADVYTATLEPKKTPGGRMQLDVRVPAEPSAACPESLPARHVVVVQNDTDQQVTPVVNEEELGTVEARSTRTFGPYDGELTFIPRTRVLDSEGPATDGYSKVEYLLADELPEYRVIVERPHWLK